jgi:hypothetical protein
MGANHSTTNTSKMEESKNEETKQNEQNEQNEKIEKQETQTNENLQKIMPNKESKEEQDTTDVLAGITEIEEKRAEKAEKDEKVQEQTGGSKKKQIPMIGGFNSNLMTESSDEILNGFKNKSGRKRYTKYDLFKMLKNLDIDTEVPQQGGGDNDEGESTSLNDDKSMEHIKNIILNELSTLKKEKSHQLGGNGCGCSGDKKVSHKMSSKLNLNKVIVDDEETKQMGGAVIIDGSSSSSSSSSDSDSDSSELGKSKKSKKSKKIKKEETESEESSKFFIETSESGMGINYDKKSDEEQTSNGENDNESEEGLSIFPFNSSDVKSSLSIKNYRMLRRKI